LFDNAGKVIRIKVTTYRSPTVKELNDYHEG